MKTTKNLFTVAMISIVTGLAIAFSMSGCRGWGDEPTLVGGFFYTTVLLVVSDPAHIQKADTLIWSETPEQTIPDTMNSFAILKQNYVYNIQIIVLDSTQKPDSAGIVNNQIIARQNYLLFCFYDSTNTNDIYGTNQSSRGNPAWANVTVTNPNYDSNNPPLPFGITDNLNTFGPTHGQLEVILRHQPDVKNGQCGPGSTDLDVYFNITVQ